MCWTEGHTQSSAKRICRNLTVISNRFCADMQFPDCLKPCLTEILEFKLWGFSHLNPPIFKMGLFVLRDFFHILRLIGHIIVINLYRPLEQWFLIADCRSPKHGRFYCILLYCSSEIHCTTIKLWHILCKEQNMMKHCYRKNNHSKVRWKNPQSGLFSINSTYQSILFLLYYRDLLTVTFYNLLINESPCFLTIYC